MVQFSLTSRAPLQVPNFPAIRFYVLLTNQKQDFKLFGAFLLKQFLTQFQQWLRNLDIQYGNVADSDCCKTFLSQFHGTYIFRVFSGYKKILSTLCFLLLFPFVEYAQVEICPTCPVKKIKEGIDQAKPYSTLTINGGEYQVENLVIDKPIKITGKNNPRIISRSGDEVFTILADSVTIKNLHISGVTTSYLKERSGIRIKRANHFSIENNILENCFFAVYLERGKHGKVKGNILKGNATTEAESGNGIHAWYCDNILIEDNEIYGHRDGIYFEFVNESMIRNNHSERNRRYGLHYMFSNDDEYVNNTFVNNGVGVAVMFSRRINMSHNIFKNNWGKAAYGLLLKEIYDAEIEHNEFDQNTVGIFVEGSNRINYRYNDFKSNGWALKFSGGCEANDVTENNFLNNSLDLVVSASHSDNKFHHNYWSNYTGYDLNKDGIGDVPYYPVKLFSYIIEKSPDAIVLMRSLFVELVNFSEKVSPVFTPKNVFDEYPLMQEVK